MSERIIIGRAEQIDFPEHAITQVPARIDTGAKTSSIWASDVHEENGAVSFVLFDKTCAWYTGQVVRSERYEQRAVASSNGAVQQRYTVKLLVVIHGRRIRASFTLADRSTQVYPVLVGRNVLRGKFVVDVTLGKPLIAEERLRSQALQERSEDKE